MVSNGVKYNLKQMVDFGNYLLSKKRQDNLIDKKDKNSVWDADLANWHQKANMLNKYFGKNSR